MIYMGNREFDGKLVGKFTVDGVDVYPDHESDKQWWYVPGTIKLAERNGKNVLSYLWYTEDNKDHDGTGFLNFEVNTAVDKNEKDQIRKEIARKTGLAGGDINLSTPTYHKGSVTFTALGPMAGAAAPNLKSKDPSVLFQSKEQLVWSAASPSLVGDNAAVCSVKFTKEGKLAAAMREAIVEGANSVAAVYSLQFLAMRPSVEFKVEGSLKKTIESFEIGVGAEIPLDVLILDVGIQAKWEKIMSNTDLKITVKTFSGEEEEGLKWAKQLLLEYILNKFFEVSLSEGVSDWGLLSASPAADAAVASAIDTEAAAEETTDEKEKATEPEKEKDTEPEKEKDTEPEKEKDTEPEKEKDTEPEKEKDTEPEKEKDTEPEKEKATEPEKEKDTEPEKEKATEPEKEKDTEPKETPKTTTTVDPVKALATAAKAAIPIPKVKVRAAYYKGTQENTINFEYSEMKAKSYPALPQALVLDGLINPKSYVTSVNRSQNPFGLAYNVTVTLPDKTSCTNVDLKNINVNAIYPVGAPADKQQRIPLTVSNGEPPESNKLPFQYDGRGSAEVEYSVDYVFSPGDWQGEKFQYSTTGKTDRGLIVAMPESVVELLTLSIGLNTGFEWDSANQAIVTLTSRKWKGEKTIVLQRDKIEQTTFKIRSDVNLASEPVHYKVDLQANGKSTFLYGPEVVVNKSIFVRDRFAGHVPVTFIGKFDSASVEVNVLYVDGAYRWEKQFTLNKNEKKPVVVPTLKELTRDKLEIEYEVVTDDGDIYTKKLSNVPSMVVVKASA